MFNTTTVDSDIVLYTFLNLALYMSLVYAHVHA